jgi:peptidoglycan/xylan/chitin deacetylase (PgdA/CDA1 family)
MKRLFYIYLLSILFASICINIIPMSNVLTSPVIINSSLRPSSNNIPSVWGVGNLDSNHIPISSLTPGNQYDLSVWYKTNTQSNVATAHITYISTNNVESRLTIPNTSPNSSVTGWQQYSNTFYIPKEAKSVVSFTITSDDGWLKIGDYSIIEHTGFNEPIISITFDDGWESEYTNGLPLLEKNNFVSTQYIISGLLNMPDYMTTAMVKNLQSQGDEIGSHTITHPYLTKLSATQLKQELAQSQATLRNLFGSGVSQDFASPYGDYNQTVLNAVKVYYRSHRSVSSGYNRKDNFNIYNILAQTVKADTTTAEVAAWVAQAKVDKAWLVIVYHKVDTSGDDYSVTPANLDTELANIKASGIIVKTIGQALDEINTQI